MKKRTITAIAATILTAAASFAHGETAAPSPQRTERAAQFADQFVDPAGHRIEFVRIHAASERHERIHRLNRGFVRRADGGSAR